MSHRDRRNVPLDAILDYAHISAVLHDVALLAVTYVLALPIGLNREREERSAGVRTFPIVGIASCGLALVAVRLVHADADSSSRVLQGLVTGIGFVGGGAILKERGGVSGTATAASVWNMGIVGAAVGFGMVHVGIILSLVNFLTLKYMGPGRWGGNGPDSRD